MATLMQRTGQRFMGLICGTTAAYVVLVALGLVMRSWPFNAAFTNVAILALLLQVPYWLRVTREGERGLRQGVTAGLLLVGALWLLYFQF